jgi:hypothetical protein
MTMEHHFWLFRQGERAYTDYKEFVGRSHAPVMIHDEILRYLSDTLQWIPTLNPAKNERSYGLNMYGPTIIDQSGGGLFQQIFASWSHLFACGPERLTLRGLFNWQWPFEEPEHVIAESELHKLGSYERMSISRDDYIERLTKLAHFGERASTGQFFVLHLGI